MLHYLLACGFPLEKKKIQNPKPIDRVHFFEGAILVIKKRKHAAVRSLKLLVLSDQSDILDNDFILVATMLTVTRVFASFY